MLQYCPRVGRRHRWYGVCVCTHVCVYACVCVCVCVTALIYCLGLTNSWYDECVVLQSQLQYCPEFWHQYLGSCEESVCYNIVQSSGSDVLAHVKSLCVTVLSRVLVSCFMWRVCVTVLCRVLALGRKRLKKNLQPRRRKRSHGNYMLFVMKFSLSGHNSPPPTCTQPPHASVWLSNQLPGSGW